MPPEERCRSGRMTFYYSSLAAGGGGGCYARAKCEGIWANPAPFILISPTSQLCQTAFCWATTAHVYRRCTKHAAAQATTRSPPRPMPTTTNTARRRASRASGKCRGNVRLFLPPLKLPNTNFSPESNYSTYRGQPTPGLSAYDTSAVALASRRRRSSARVVSSFGALLRSRVRASPPAGAGPHEKTRPREFRDFSSFWVS